MQQAGLAGLFHLLAQVAHVHIEGVRVANERCTPHGIEDLLAWLHFTGIRDQVLE
jgi:hypothetical protein